MSRFSSDWVNTVTPGRLSSDSVNTQVNSVKRFGSVGSGSGFSSTSDLKFHFGDMSWVRLRVFGSNIVRVKDRSTSQLRSNPVNCWVKNQSTPDPVKFIGTNFSSYRLDSLYFYANRARTFSDYITFIR
ncbi:hypothetical protein Hanom_Chr12g01172241 [Helianthus anomalus]